MFIRNKKKEKNNMTSRIFALNEGLVTRMIDYWLLLIVDYWLDTASVIFNQKLFSFSLLKLR